MPIHPKTLAAFAKKGLTTSEDPKTGREVPLQDFELQMIRGIGMGNQNTDHNSWYWLVDKLKEAGEKPIESISAAKRVVDPKSKKEYVLVAYRIEGTHYDGTPLSETWREYGLYFVPNFKKVYDGKRNRWLESDEVVSSTTVYQFEFEGEKTKIESPISGKMLSITDLIREDTQFHAITDKGKKLKVVKDDWFNLSSREKFVSKYNANPVNSALEDLTRAISRAQELTGQQNKK